MDDASAVPEANLPTSRAGLAANRDEAIREVRTVSGRLAPLGDLVTHLVRCEISNARNEPGLVVDKQEYGALRRKGLVGAAAALFSTSGHPTPAASPRSCTSNPTTPDTLPSARCRRPAPRVQVVPAPRPFSESPFRRTLRRANLPSRSLRG